MNWRRIWLIAAFDLRYSALRVKGLLFLFPYFLCWYMILRKVDENISAWFQSMEGLAVTAAWLDIDSARQLFIEHPPVLSLFFIASLLFAPVFCMLAGHDQFSSDLADGCFRFLTTRCKRLEIFIGRYLSALCLVCAGLTVTGLTAGAMSEYIEDYPALQVAVYFVRIMLTLGLYNAALLAYMAIISATIKSPLGSLLLGAATYAGLIFIGFVANSLYGQTAIFSYLLPGALKPLLLDTETFIAALAALITYVTIYLGLAWFIFRRRNL